MQYAQVIVNRPSNKTYSYAISASDLPYINIGTVVEVDFGPNSILAVVVALKKTVPDVQLGSLKTIKRIAAEFRLPLLVEPFSHYLVQSYLCTLERGYFGWMGASLPKRISKQNHPWQEPTAKSQSVTSISISAADLEQNILKLVKKGHKAGKSIRIITGTVEEYKLIDQCLKQSNLDVEILSSVGLNQGAHYTLLKKIAQNSSEVIIGTRTLAFIPPRIDELWLVINPLASSAWEQRHPNYSINGLTYFYKRYCKIISLYYYSPPYIKPIIHSEKHLPFKHELRLINRISPPHYQEKMEALLNVKEIHLFVPKFYRQKLVYCLRCESALESSCCQKSIVVDAQNKMLCRQCQTTQAPRCQLCQSGQIVTKQNYFLQKCIEQALLQKTKLKIVYTNDLQIFNKREATAIIFGYDYLLESIDFFATEQWLKNIAVASQTYKQSIVISDLIESNQAITINDIAHNLFNQKAKNLMPPYGKSIVVNFYTPQSADDFYSELAPILTNFCYKMYKHPQAAKVAILINHQQWLGLKKFLEDGKFLKQGAKKIKSIDIDPYYFI